MAKAIRADIYDILTDYNIQWHYLSDRTVLVTGATGLIGTALVHAISAANEKYALNIRLIAHGRNKNKGDALVREFGIEFVPGDIREPSAGLNGCKTFEYVFHCAAITKSVDMLAKPVDVIHTELGGIRNMLELAKAKGCISFVYLSSMEVYGQTELHEVFESDLGSLDLSNPRSSYPEGKRLSEMLCVAYAAQYSMDVKIARLAQTFGAGTNINDSRVFAQFLRSVINGTDIKLHTDGKSRGNYCYISDTIRGIITVLLKGESGETYNISNPATSTTIREMAELVANKIGKGNIKVDIDIPDDIKSRGYAPDSGFTLNVDKLKSLGWAPKYELVEMYRRMLECNVNARGVQERYEQNQEQ